MRLLHSLPINFLICLACYVYFPSVVAIADFLQHSFGFGKAFSDDFRVVVWRGDAPTLGSIKALVASCYECLKPGTAMVGLSDGHPEAKQTFLQQEILSSCESEHSPDQLFTNI